MTSENRLCVALSRQKRLLVVVGDAQLNIFEETVLGLWGICGRNVEEISDLSCLEKDFVKAIGTSLQKNNLITANNILTDAGKNYLNQTSLAENIEVQAVKIITLPDTGQLLKIVLKDQKLNTSAFLKAATNQKSATLF